jgi:oligoribonuclease
MKKLFWLDMEMTGLEPEIERVIEVAVIITDLNFKPLDTYHAVVQQPEAFLENMDEWNTKHHTASGLVAKVPTGKKPQEVEQDLLDLIKKHYADEERPVLCGNSIFQDRKFIDLYFKKFSKRLHYRMMDVTAWKIIMNACYHVEYQKKDSHRALDDIMESIEELKAFLKHVTKEPAKQAP